MARAYDNDLRRKFFAAYDRGEGSLRVLAARFGVSVQWAWKISAHRRQTGEVEQPRYHRGGYPKLTPAQGAALARWLREQPSLTLDDLVERLAATQQVQVSRSCVWYTLRRLGLRHKKRRCTRRNKNRRPRSSSGPTGARKSLGWPRRGCSSTTKPERRRS